MFALRTQLYTPANYYPDIPVLDEEFDLTLAQDAGFADFSVEAIEEFASNTRFD